MADAESLRPRYHFTPPANWMNDPNGLIYVDGVYHLYYQHNPYGTAWGHMSWGHAVSSDLVHWEHRPIAIWEEPEAGYTIFSGSAVVDHMNTSGLGDGSAAPLVAIYTADYSTRDPVLQDIHIAYSLDGGDTFTQYAGNPVITAGQRKFGDPKVFWHDPTERWIMVNICGLGQGHVVLYASPDLKVWTRLSEFHAPGVAPGTWECPDLFPLAVDGSPDEVYWVLKVNCVTFGDSPPATRFFVGSFDGRRFTDAVPAGRSLTSDEGAIYAEVTYNDVADGRRILLGWLRQQPDEARPWTGAQSVPRILTLRQGSHRGIALCQQPVEALTMVRGERRVVRDQNLTEEIRIEDAGLGAGAADIQLVLDLRGATEGGIRLELAEQQGADRQLEVRIGINGESGELFIESASGRRVAAGIPLSDDPVTLRVLLDREILEVFLDDIAGVTACLPYGAQTQYEALSIYGRGVAPHLIRADIWSMGG